MRNRLAGHIATLAVALVTSIVVLVALFDLSGFLSFGHTESYKVVVPQAGSMVEGTTVLMAGARVGSVKSVARRGVGAVVDVKITDKSVLPLAKDTKARLDVRTPLGENYIALEPGSSKTPLKSGGLVMPDEKSEYVDVDQILSELQGKTRDRTRDVIEGLGTGVANRGQQLNTSLGHTSNILREGTGITLKLKDDGNQIASLSRNLGAVSRALGERQSSIQQVAHQGVVTFSALADRDEKLREFIDALPGTLSQVRDTTTRLQRTSNVASPVVSNLAVALREVRPSVRHLAPAASAGRGVVQNLGTASQPLQKTVSALKATAPKLTTLFPRFRGALCQVDPFLRYVKPYTADLTSFITSLGSSANSYDAVGHTIRLLPVINQTALLGAPKQVNEAAQQLIQSGLFAKTTGLTFKPFPQPNQEMETSDDVPNRIAGPDQVPSTGYKYPHVTADC